MEVLEGVAHRIVVLVGGNVLPEHFHSSSIIHHRIDKVVEEHTRNTKLAKVSPVLKKTSNFFSESLNIYFLLLF